MSKCICRTPTEYVSNTHRNGRYIQFNIMGNDEDKGVVLWEHLDVLATFNINFCPICGDKLHETKK